MDPMVCGRGRLTGMAGGCMYMRTEVFLAVSCCMMGKSWCILYCVVGVRKGIECEI